MGKGCNNYFIIILRCYNNANNDEQIRKFYMCKWSINLWELRGEYIDSYRFTRFSFSSFNGCMAFHLKDVEGCVK